MNGRVQLAEVLVPSPQANRSAQRRNNNRGKGDDSDDSDCDTDSDDDIPRVESRHAFWLQRHLKTAIYGSVWAGGILKRLDEPFMTENGERVSWEATELRCAVKIYSRHQINQKRGNAEDPINEIAAMQFLYDHQRRRLQMDISEELEGGELFRNALDSSFEGNVMMPLGMYFNNSDIFNVMPYSDGGELFDVLDKRSRFSENEARYWMQQIINGVETLHRAGICHRDMSLENILTDRSGRALVIDMGMCVKIPYVDDPFNPNEVDPRRFDDHRERQRCLIAPDKACGKVRVKSRSFLCFICIYVIRI